MAKTGTVEMMTDAEWNEKFNGPRDRLMTKIFGDTPCPATDLSPKTIITDKNWEKKKDFMTSSEPRVTNPMNMPMEGAKWFNEQIHANRGKIISAMKIEEPPIEDVTIKVKKVKK